MSGYNIDVIMHHKAEAEKHASAGNKSSYHEHMYGMHSQTSKYHQYMANKSLDKKQVDNHSKLADSHKQKASEHFGYYMNADKKINESYLSFKDFHRRKI